MKRPRRPGMDLATFERRALAYWEAIPRRFREGVSAFVIEPGTWRKEEFEEGWVYGYCEPDDAIMSLPDAPVTSRITLFYGSFVNIAADDPDFDWEAELEETVRHELQHHLEWRSGFDDLEVDDWLQDENERRVTGAAFTPWFHRRGAALGASAWLADHTLFVEVERARADWPALATTPCEVAWADLVLRSEPVPAELLDAPPLYVPAEVEGPEDAAWPWDEAVLVLSPRRRWWWPW